MNSAKRLEELVIWQRACELRDGIEVALEQGAGKRDMDFRDQILASSRSVSANIAEGYGHVRPRPFIRYLLIARASLLETLNHLLGKGRKVFSKSDLDRFRSLTFRILRGISRLIAYLKTCNPDLDFLTLDEKPRRDRSRKAKKSGMNERTREPLNPNQ